jgi:hypothetical protein
MGNFCLDCGKRSTCKEICKALEKRLKERDIAGYTERHRRRKELLFEPKVIELIASKRVFEIKYGKAYFKGRRGEDKRE